MVGDTFFFNQVIHLNSEYKMAIFYPARALLNITEIESNLLNNYSEKVLISTLYQKMNIYIAIRRKRQGMILVDSVSENKSFREKKYRVYLNVNTRSHQLFFPLDPHNTGGRRFKKT